MNRTELLSRKEAAAAIKRSRWYIWQCERAGLRFIAGRITLEKLTEFLEKHPQPSRRSR